MKEEPRKNLSRLNFFSVDGKRVVKYGPASCEEIGARRRHTFVSSQTRLWKPKTLAASGCAQSARCACTQCPTKSNFHIRPSQSPIEHLRVGQRRHRVVANQTADLRWEVHVPLSHEEPEKKEKKV